MLSPKGERERRGGGGGSGGGGGGGGGGGVYGHLFAGTVSSFARMTGENRHFVS